MRPRRPMRKNCRKLAYLLEHPHCHGPGISLQVESRRIMRLAQSIPDRNRSHDDPSYAVGYSERVYNPALAGRMVGRDNLPVGQLQPPRVLQLLRSAVEISCRYPGASQRTRNPCRRLQPVEVEFVIDPYSSVEVPRAEMETSFANCPTCFTEYLACSSLGSLPSSQDSLRPMCFLHPTATPDDSPPAWPYPHPLIARFHPAFRAMLSWSFAPASGIRVSCRAIKSADDEFKISAAPPPTHWGSLCRWPTTPCHDG